MAIKEVYRQINHIIIPIFTPLISYKFLKSSVMILTERFQEKQGLICRIFQH